MCHRVSQQRDWQCKCGYEFGQDVERVRLLLRDQQTNASILLVILLLLEVAAVGGVVYSAVHGFVVYSVWGFVMLTLWTARTTRKLVITRSSLRQLAGRELPKASVHQP